MLVTLGAQGEPEKEMDEKTFWEISREWGMKFRQSRKTIYILRYLQGQKGERLKPSEWRILKLFNWKAHHLDCSNFPFIGKSCGHIQPCRKTVVNTI